MKPLISFCSQCKGRKHHLEETLQHNLSLIEPFSQTDFVLLDFDSPDGLEEWIHTNFKPYLTSGKLKYHKVHNQPYYFQSAVKNLSHNLSTGINIVNVDADNFLSEEYVMRVVSTFTENDIVVVHVSTPNKEHWDLFGRIGMSRKIFNLVKGYDEIYEHWGGEDTDLLRRIHNLQKEMNFEIIELPASISGGSIIHGAGSRNQYRSEITQSYLPAKKITSRYYGALNYLKKKR